MKTNHTEYVLALKQILESNRNDETAIGQKAYMRNQFEFLGLKTNERKELTARFTKENGLPEHDFLALVVKEFWALPEREYQYFAIELMGKFIRKAVLEDIELLEWMITNKSWWDSVDSIASLTGIYFLKFPDQKQIFIKKWLESDNIWLKRVSIIFQLSYRQKTDEALLFANILHCKDIKEFFIQKAIGWALRQYTRTNPEAVFELLDSYEFSNLVKKEAMKWLMRKGLK